MNRQIHFVHDLLAAATEALVQRDGDTLTQLVRTAGGWLQSSEETETQTRLLLAMAEAAYLLDGEPSELEEDD
ncbi:hypothetical protein [Cereibacter sphaeroides]|jgi:hypothetical protein|uniref:hypothetical protein n=1 Tax=Cereibacter sphaeroides TaxID=1063 RepID=UPI0000F29EBB|nr:hypothetical protein Rsph17029_0648 [Cereibacter sphaeroides ATCC 17029]